MLAAPGVTAAAGVAADLIRLEGLVKRFGAVTALAGVSLAVQQGEFIALLGPSGCGKTTLLRMIAGFGEPDQGTIQIDGRPMNGVPPNRRPVNTVFQNYALFPHLTVAENIAFGPRRRGLQRAAIAGMVADALSLVGMGGFEARYPAQLSGGQQQRIALARAIVNRPKVLLLDEPLGALDLKLRKRMQLELKHLQERLGITFVFVTHDQEEALVMADRIAVMNEGRIVQLGSGAEIYRNPNSRFVADFIGEANLLPCQVDGGRLRMPGGNALPYDAPDAANGTLTLLVRPEHIDLGAGLPERRPVALSATVRERVFLGSVVRVHAELGDGCELVLQPRDVWAAERLVAGQRIVLHWAAEDARILGD